MLVYQPIESASKSIYNKFYLFESLFCFLNRNFVKKFDSLFRLEEIYGSLKISSIYLKKINQWLHNDESLIEQIKRQVNPILYLEVKTREYLFLKRIIKIYNRHTHEEMLYNYMRSQRPQSKSEQSAES